MDNYIPSFLIPFVGWGGRHYLIKHNDYTVLKKITLGIGPSAWFVTEMARSFYRPYIYAHHIDDWVIADTVGNSSGTVTAVFMILTMSGRGTSRDWRLVAMVIAGLIGYEMVSTVGGHPFDVNDVLATLLLAESQFSSMRGFWPSMEERKRNEGAVACEFARLRCVVGDGGGLVREQGAHLAPLPMGCGAPRFPPCARLRNRGGIPGFPSACYAASSPEGRLRAGLSCRLRFRLGHRVLVA